MDTNVQIIMSGKYTYAVDKKADKKAEDWYIDDTNQVRQSITSDADYWNARKDYSKIVASNNPELSGIPRISIDFLVEWVNNPEANVTMEVDFEWIANPPKRHWINSDTNPMNPKIVDGCVVLKLAPKKEPSSPHHSEMMEKECVEFAEWILTDYIESYTASSIKATAQLYAEYQRSKTKG